MLSGEIALKNNHYYYWVCMCAQMFVYQHIDIYAVHILCIYEEKISMHVCICEYICTCVCICLLCIWNEYIYMCVICVCYYICACMYISINSVYILLRAYIVCLCVCAGMNVYAYVYICECLHMCIAMHT